MASVREISAVCADAIDAASETLRQHNVGGHSTRGHRVLLSQIGASIRQDGAVGKLSHAFEGSHMYAAAGPRFAELPPVIADLVTKAGLELDAAGTVTLEQLDACAGKSALTSGDRITLKTALLRSGRLVAA